MNEKRLNQMFNKFEKELIQLIRDNQEDTMSAITDLTDAVSSLQAEDQEVVAAVLVLTQKIADLTAAVAAGGSNVDPAIVAATNAIKAVVVDLHNSVVPGSTTAPVVPTAAQVSAFQDKTPAPTADQVARYKTNNLTHAEETQFNVYPTAQEVINFNKAVPAATADQIARFNSNQLTAAELVTFGLNS